MGCGPSRLRASGCCALAADAEVPDAEMVGVILSSGKLGNRLTTIYTVIEPKLALNAKRHVLILSSVRHWSDVRRRGP